MLMEEDMPWMLKDGAFYSGIDMLWGTYHERETQAAAVNSPNTASLLPFLFRRSRHLLYSRITQSISVRRPANDD